MKSSYQLTALVLCMLGMVSCITTTTPPENLSSEPTPTAVVATLNARLEAEAERRKTVIFDAADGEITDPENWNPLIPNRRLDHGFHQAVIEPLFILNYETGEIEGWLGESMTANETSDVWVLKLRDGIKWSDGEPFTVDDVIFTLDLMVEYPDLAGASTMNTWIKSYEMLDNLTIQFILTRPNPRFQLDVWSVKVWGGPIIVPEHIWQGQDPMTFTNYDPAKGWPIFTGPYTLVSVTTQKALYQRDDNWWGAETGWQNLPKPEQLAWVSLGGAAENVKAMANHQLDATLGLSLADLLELKAENPKMISYYDDLPYAWVPDPCSRTLDINHLVGPWNDKTMRWALNYAIDRDEIVAFAFDNTTIPSRHFFPSYAPLNRYVDLLEEGKLYETYPLLEHNPDKTKAILETAGYQMNQDGFYEKDGEPLVFTFYSLDSEEYKNIGALIIQQLARAGISATMTVVPYSNNWFNGFVDDGVNGQLNWLCGSVNEPWASMDTFNSHWFKPQGQSTNEGQNVARWSGDGANNYSHLVDELGALPLGRPEIDPLFVDAMEIWLDELPILPLTQASVIVPFDTAYWKGWPSSSNNYIHPPFWWMSTHKIIHELEPVEP